MMRKPTRLSGKAWSVVFLMGMAAAAASAAPPKEDVALRREIEGSCRKFLDFFADLQVNGGWAVLYHHPTLWAFGGGERHVLKSSADVDYSKGGFTAQKIMQLYLPAYEVLGDKRYLEAARRSCDVLVKGQFPNGVLQAHYYVRPDGRVEAARSGDSIEMPSDEGPGPTITMLIWTARLCRQAGYADWEKYKKAAMRCAELYIKAQNPNGSWAQKYNLRTGRVGGLGYGVLNDGATTDPMRNLLLVYHATKDPKFLAPIVKAGDWLVRVQNKQGGIPGWAEQYGKDDLPCWARSFEPPAVCVTSTGGALGTLVMLYQLTHNDKYLQPARILIKWLREHPREKWGFYTDPKTADFLWAKNRKIYRGGRSDRMRSGLWVQERNFRVFRPDFIERRYVKAAIQAAKNPPRHDLEKQKPGWRRRFWTEAPRFRKDIAKQNARGYWPGRSTWHKRAMQCANTVTYAPVGRMLRTLHYLAAAEARVQPYAVGSGRSCLRAWPVPDLYDTPLRKKAR